MASISEKILNINIIDFLRIKDLRIRLLYTLFIIVMYRFVLNIPLPFINISVMEEMYKSSDLLGMLNMFTGGGLERFSIAALGIAPYISASIFVQLATSFIPYLKSLKKEGDAGQRMINQYTRYLTILITILQGYALSIFAEALTSPTLILVLEKGYFFRFTSVISLLVGTLVIMWFGEQITSRGLGQGTSIIIYAGILANLPGAIINILSTGKNSSASLFFITIFITIAILSFIVFFERAYKPIYVIHAKKQKLAHAKYDSYIPMKVNVSNVMPVIFANMILLLPVSILNFFYEGNIISNIVYKYLFPGSSGFLIATGIMIVIFSFIYAPIAFDTNEIAENLNNQNTYIQNIRPRKQTADYLYTILMRITCIGVGYLLIIAVMPDIIFANFLQKQHISGTSFLIVVNVTLELISQMYSYVTYDRYKGLKKFIS